MKASYANVRGVLEHCGPLTMQEVAQFFPDHHYTEVAAMITGMRAKVTKRIYIKEWTREGIGRRYLRAIYALGDRPDARKPPPMTNAQWQRESRARRALPKAANSVFSWASQL